APITREQMAVMLHRFVRLKDMELQTTSNITINFADQHHISYWATEAVNALQAAGIIEGRLGNSFDPLSTATRAEAAAVFVRLAETAQ
ncbi:MAG: S-layer homology domain-containing protein, partial [Defluviitaleaceae bacterium]|nr:S-layer homology domain-containing protein [Defluviitaleaceae bacterium]